MPKTFWNVTPTEEELLLEFWRDNEMVVILSVEKDGIGYALKKGKRFESGAHDPASDFAGAMREIAEFIET